MQVHVGARGQPGCHPLGADCYFDKGSFSDLALTKHLGLLATNQGTHLLLPRTRFLFACFVFSRDNGGLSSGPPALKASALLTELYLLYLELPAPTQLLELHITVAT